MLIYDGHCPFCTREAQRLVQFSHGRLGAQSCHEPGVVAAVPGLRWEDCMVALQLVSPSGRRVSGAAAVAGALWARGGVGRLAAVYELPGLRQLLNAAYRLVATHRTRWWGTTCPDGTCHRHGAPS